MQQARYNQETHHSSKKKRPMLLVCDGVKASLRTWHTGTGRPRAGKVAASAERRADDFADGRIRTGTISASSRCEKNSRSHLSSQASLGSVNPSCHISNLVGRELLVISVSDEAKANAI